MFAILFSWTIMAFILFTFGDMLLAFYHRICKQGELYNFPEKILLGLCALIVPLSFWSVWLPSNQSFLFLAIIASVFYWGVNFRKVKEFCDRSFGADRRSFLSSESIFITGFILTSLLFFTWQQEVYDSAFYHYQNIRWNEEFAVVPGLGNIDDRFGFNSNYFLLSAVFSFRFLFGEAIYSLHSLIVTTIGIWILHELFKSNCELKRLIVFVAYILLFCVSIYFLGNTSTDILPNFIAFYLLARIVLYPDFLKQNYLIGIALPVFLLTCKLSFFPIGLISLFLLYHLIKEKRYKALSFVCFFGLLTIVPWLIRNVIISGYLIYPLYQIDLFHFDWKVPLEVAMKQKDYIFDIGYYFFRIAVRYPHMSIREPLAINILTDIIYLLTFISFLIATYFIVKKRERVKFHICLLYSVFFLSIIVWITGGPDIRFVSGILCAAIFVGGVLLSVENKERYFASIAKTSCFIFFVSILSWTANQYYNFKVDNNVDVINLVQHSLLKPLSVRDQQLAKGVDISREYEVYPINNGLSIWVGSDLPYDMPVPASIHSHYSKFWPIDCIEARGKTIQDGFRVKEN